MRPHPRVLIIDDEPAIAELISVNLRHHGLVPIWAEDGASAQRMLDTELPDVALLDWMLPGENGLLLLQKWRANPRTRTLPIVMLTSMGLESDKVIALDAGADDYVTKPFSPQELLARIRAVMRRNQSAPANDKVAVGDLSLDAATHRVSFHDQEFRLAGREFKLLRHLMTHAERVHTRPQLLDTVWHDNLLVEERTVDTHIKRLRDALGDAGAMIETVRGAGYRLTSAPQLPA